MLCPERASHYHMRAHTYIQACVCGALHLCLQDVQVDMHAPAFTRPERVHDTCRSMSGRVLKYSPPCQGWEMLALVCRAAGESSPQVSKDAQGQGGHAVTCDTMA